MQDINKQLKELQSFFDFVDKRDQELWNKYLGKYEISSQIR